jgi:hypothetical protein
MADKSSAIKKDDGVMKISDLKTAAFLVANDFNVRGISWEGRRCFFHFESSEEFDKLLHEYRFGEGLVAVKKIYAAQDELKSLLFDLKES